MFASDDVDCDETWEVTKSVNDLKMTDQYWSYPLSEENLKLVNTIQDLQSCIKVVFKVNRLPCFMDFDLLISLKLTFLTFLIPLTSLTFIDLY